MTRDIFLAQKESIIPKARYFTLKQNYMPTTKDVHVFTEDGDDYEFYRTAINQVFIGYKPFKYFMKGKTNLIELYQLIDWTRYRKSKLLFFADKDYDDILEISQIKQSNFFYTKYYSIENYLVTEEVFSIILDRYYVNELTDDLENKLLKLFRDSYEQFAIKLRTLTWFILIDRLVSKRAVLEELKLSLLIHFDKMQYFEKKLVSQQYYDKIMRSNDNHKKNLIRYLTLKDILVNKCGAASDDYHFENIMLTRRLIKDIDQHKNFLRGKYDLWFFLEILKTVDKTIESIYNAENLIPTNENPIPRRKLEITTQNIFDLVSSKMEIPTDVIIFLTNNYNTLNGNN
ncbi:DUF4435 domain-containing protein [Chryseobacterium sp.]|uniref:DUF4435 domain-containing protein n=1 Tax=Chryseobacterium sp. TaxID=1871047 RepID=UPI00333F870B